MNKYKTIKNYKDLIVWQQGHQLVLNIYKITKKFPKQETYSLTDQIRRATVSVTSNIAEGFGRRSTKEKQQFYYLARGSLIEVDNQLTIAKDLKYISTHGYHHITEQITSVHKLLNRLITSTKQKISP